MPIYKIDTKMKQWPNWGAIEKSPILLSQYWNIDNFETVPKIILHFGGTNNIFVDFNIYIHSVLFDNEYFLNDKFI